MLLVLSALLAGKRNYGQAIKMELKWDRDVIEKRTYSVSCLPLQPSKVQLDSSHRLGITDFSSSYFKRVLPALKKVAEKSIPTFRLVPLLVRAQDPF